MNQCVTHNSETTHMMGVLRCQAGCMSQFDSTIQCYGVIQCCNTNRCYSVIQCHSMVQCSSVIQCCSTIRCSVDPGGMAHVVGAGRESCDDIKVLPCCCCERPSVTRTACSVSITHSTQTHNIPGSPMRMGNANTNTNADAKYD